MRVRDRLLAAFVPLAVLAWLAPAGAATPADSQAMLVFAPGSAKLEPENQPLLDRLAMLTRIDVANWIILEACSDDYGSREMNLALHQQRFNAIEREIVARGILPHRVRGLTSRDHCGAAARQKLPSVAARVEKPDH